MTTYGQMDAHFQRFSACSTSSRKKECHTVTPILDRPRRSSGSLGPSLRRAEHGSERLLQGAWLCAHSVAPRSGSAKCFQNLATHCSHTLPRPDLIGWRAPRCRAHTVAARASCVSVHALTRDALFSICVFFVYTSLAAILTYV